MLKFISLKEKVLNGFGKTNFISNQIPEERIKYLNECARKTLERINLEIDEVGIEARRRRLAALRFKASEYTWKQECAEAREARRRENDVYNVFI
ncbi:MAG: hypothetical protein ABFQ65_01855 [Nanoarchaeota archaeon]